MRRPRQQPTSWSSARWYDYEKAQHAYLGIDADNNGVPSRAELVAVVEGVISRSERGERGVSSSRDNNAREDAREGAAREATEATVKQWFDSMDFDRDGLISFREYMRHTALEFPRSETRRSDSLFGDAGGTARLDTLAGLLSSSSGGSLNGGSDLAAQPLNMFDTPYTFAAGLVMISLCVYVGGLVFRLW